jgi:hypothetical protein
MTTRPDEDLLPHQRDAVIVFDPRLGCDVAIGYEDLPLFRATIEAWHGRRRWWQVWAR